MLRRCCGACTSGRRNRRALARARRRLGAAHRRPLLQLQRPARDAGFRRRAGLGRAKRLERALPSHSQPTRHAETTRKLGLPACRALIAFGRGDDSLAVSLLATLPPQARRLGGSHAQRDVLQLTLLRAVERLREAKGWSSDDRVAKEDLIPA